MPDEKTGADALRVYLTGATSDGGTQVNPDAALGNFRSSTEVPGMAWDLWQMFEGLTIQQVSGACGAGTAYLASVGDNELKFTAPGEGGAGIAVTIAQGETKVLESGSSGSKYCRVNRWGSAPFKGVVPVQLSTWFNNAVGMSNILDAERSAGEDKVRCLCLKADCPEGVDTIKTWVKPLGASFVSDVQQLPASGTGFIETSGTTEAIGKHGFLRVEDSGGTLKEIAFYTARHSSQKVEVTNAAHRGLLGTTAQAGSATDVVWPVPGIRVAYQAPTVQPDGSAYVASDENDIPPGLTWYSAITSTTGPVVASLATGQIQFLWLRLTFPACAGSSNVAFANALNSIGLAFMPGV